LLPGTLLRHSIEDGLIVPHYLDERDHPWLRCLLDEHERFVGRPRRELDARLDQSLPCESPTGKRAMAAHVMSRLSPPRTPGGLPPRKVRAAVFAGAARAEAPREEIFADAARALGVSPELLGDALFADLPGERQVVPFAQPVSPGELALRTNLALAQSMMARASDVRVELHGNARAVVRHAKLRGLICAVHPHEAPDAAILDVSGPFTLFRRTHLYGRALGGLLPPLAWCHRFRLRASCVIGGKRLTLALATGDPIFPAPAPRAYDSQLEERFARDFRRLAPDWDVVREPEPVPAAGTLVFPDFVLRHRADPERRWILEIVGFWTPDYLRRKLEQYRDAGLPNLILCVDADRDCADGELPPGARVLRFKRRVDARAVLALVEPP
jgi:predicted nuclease of restriction endonuclease-like RecB superfamily